MFFHDRLYQPTDSSSSIILVVAWFGTICARAIAPCARRWRSPPSTVPLWSVNFVSRASAHLVSRDAEDRPVYGGIPADFAVVQAIQEMKARGLRVTFYPFLLMDMPPGSTLPNPDSANAATPGQPAFP